MYKYHFVAINVAPKRKKLKQAMEELEVTEKILFAAKKKLYDVESGVARLQRQYNDSMAKKQFLEDKCKLCMARLDRADKVSLVSDIVLTLFHCLNSFFTVLTLFFYCLNSFSLS